MEFGLNLDDIDGGFFVGDLLFGLERLLFFLKVFHLNFDLSSNL
jgi:hypothetical protein